MHLKVIIIVHLSSKFLIFHIYELKSMKWNLYKSSPNIGSKFSLSNKMALILGLNFLLGGS